MVFCIEIALNALIGDRVPVGVWLIAALYPVCFLSVPQKAEAFLGILSIASGSRCVWDPDGKALAGGGSCDCGAWCILWSAFHPPSSASGDTGTEFPLPAAAVVVIAAFWSAAISSPRRIVCLFWEAFFVWLPGILIKRYADNYLSYVKINAGSAGVIPEKIFSGQELLLWHCIP